MHFSSISYFAWHKTHLNTALFQYFISLKKEIVPSEADFLHFSLDVEMERGKSHHCSYGNCQNADLFVLVCGQKMEKWSQNERSSG